MGIWFQRICTSSLAIILLQLPIAPVLSIGWTRHLGIPSKVVPSDPALVAYKLRGGSAEEEPDEERYSRQVYTLGARAHSLIRSSTVYLDGPSASGLVYECAKNLALSGVGSIVVVTSDEAIDSNYFNPQLDDLGQSYISAAVAETGIDRADATLLESFIGRLNPSITVKTISRSALRSQGKSHGIILSIDRPFSTQIELNAISRDMGFAFVGAETAGVYGRIFCDFGPSFEVHDVDGEAPLVVPFERLEVTDEEDICMVHTVEGERHDVSKGDQIRFQLKGGQIDETKMVVSRVYNPNRFSVRIDAVNMTDAVGMESFIEDMNARAVSFSRIKILQIISFQSLEAATSSMKSDGSLFSPCDLEKSFDGTRRDAVFSCFQALSMHASNSPTGMLADSVDGDSFLELAKSESIMSSHDSTWAMHCKQFAQTCAAKFVPIQGIFGALAAQESLKAASGLYNPVQQFLLYDCDEVLSSWLNPGDSAKLSSAATGQEYILGSKVDASVRSKKIFIVGAGAIGCEILKNLAAMGGGTSKKGYLIVTDMDTIERSNLSRQLLFRDGDIGAFKSVAAKRAINHFNPNVKIDAYTLKVGDEEKGPFDDRFWSKGYSIILNALDNMDARLYMDSKCVANAKAMVDAGTLGSKGNVQVVVPFQSESYGSSADPPEPSIPVCTLKNFPYMISHTIQWGRDMFDGFFVRRIAQANEYADVLSKGAFKELTKQLTEKLSDEAAYDSAVELAEDHATSSINNAGDFETLKQASLQWAAETAKRLFFDKIKALLVEHPADSLDDENEPFWSGSRRVPVALSYSTGANRSDGSDIDAKDDVEQEKVNANLVDFVKAAARLRVETFSAKAREMGPSSITTEDAIKALEKMGPNGVDSGSGSGSATSPDTTGKSMKSRIRNKLKTIPSGDKQKLFVAEFEKDDDSNGHVAFVTAASNLRALCYGIAPVDAMETRRVAGRIVPAMITTTAFVSALSCLEYIKLVQGAQLTKHRNAFINLALPFFAFTAPLPALELEGLRGEKYTLWDKIVLKESKRAANEGGLTLNQLLKKLKSKAWKEDPSSIEVTSINYGPYMIYADFLHGDDPEILNENIWTLVRNAVESGQAFDEEFSRDDVAIVSNDDDDDNNNTSPHDQGAGQLSSLDLTVVVEDFESGSEVEIPPVRVVKFKPS